MLKKQSRVDCCVYLDTNIITDAIYAKYLPGKSNPLQQTIASDFDSLRREVLQPHGGKVICVNRFQLDVELKRAVLNEFLKNACKLKPEDLITLNNEIENLIMTFKRMQKLGFVIIVEYPDAELADVARRLYIACKSRGLLGKGRKVGSQDLIVVASMYLLLANKCSSLEFWTEDRHLYELLRDLSKLCSSRSHSYTYTLIFYDKNINRRTSPSQLYLCIP